MEFVKFKRAVHAQFNQLAAGADMLFLTNVDKDALWDCYLNSFPEEERQSHNCKSLKLKASSKPGLKTLPNLN